MKIVSVPIERVVPYERNPRRNEGAVEKVANSLREFGWQQPIVVDSEMVVIAGHTRLLAARRMGLETVPVRVAENLTPEQVRAYRIADNRTGEEAEWDPELLALELGELRLSGYDLDLTGFDVAEIAKALARELDGTGGESDTGKSGAGSLAARFGVVPFSVLNAREGWWQDRKTAWLSLGIKSELGRGETPKSGAVEPIGGDVKGNFLKRRGYSNATPGGGTNARR
jgi:ParB-like chromosome segregation protein Spo0J